MTIEEAVAILNQRNHGNQEWRLVQSPIAPYPGSLPPIPFICGELMYDRGERICRNYEPFEAIAIAERYRAGVTPDAEWERLGIEGASVRRYYGD